MPETQSRPADRSTTTVPAQPHPPVRDGVLAEGSDTAQPKRKAPSRRRNRRTP